MVGCVYIESRVSLGESELYLWCVIGLETGHRRVPHFHNLCVCVCVCGGCGRGKERINI